MNCAEQDVAFHLTDWIGDLSAFVKFCNEPDSPAVGEVNEVLLAFLIHVPNHVAAAAKLYAELPVTDVFGVQAVGGSEA